jgi:hypothetical protein
VILVYWMASFLPPPPPLIPDASAAEAVPPITLSDIISQGWLAPLIASAINSVSDLLAFAALSHACNVVALTPPLEGLTTSHRWSNPESIYHAHDWQPLLLPERPQIHTVMLKCRWNDQGWGNRKGMLSVVLAAGKAPDDYQPWSDAVKCGKEPAPHRPETLSLSFRPEATEKYKICARAGGGGGHSLDVSNLCVRTIAFKG